MLLDIHCHLTDKYFNDKIEHLIKACNAQNIGIIISAGLNPEDNKKVLELSRKFDIVKASLGIYPIDSISLTEHEIDNEIDFIKKNKNKIIAISEVGLDLFYTKKIKKQREVFQKFIELSEKISKPLIIHSRKAEQEVIAMLESSRVKFPIFHSFGGNKNLVKRAIDNECYFSVPPLIVRSSNFQTLVSLVPLNQLLTESDSPYQSPKKEEENTPINVRECIRKISEIKNLDNLETENIIFMNFQKIFKKWKTI
ncbi:TatD family hydrolase [Candidatus Woesearchaeota archaeon]|nr:TatD family hydrolase [Candidatus Woesearchaeota archaeon]